MVKDSDESGPARISPNTSAGAAQVAAASAAPFDVQVRQDNDTEHPGSTTWELLENGPDRWRARIAADQPATAI